MPAIQSNVSASSDAFKANAAHMRELVAEMRDKAAAIERGGPEEARQRHVSRGKLLPRERLAQL
ncbi:MAG: methylcrotonoyl-CoA carboxylase, partial [Rhizobiaceae bacterium]